MNITAKSRYALKVMMDLALSSNLSPNTRSDVAARQGLPIDFMDQIISKLKTAGLIETTRGRSGGLLLKKPPSDITLWDIFFGVEEHIFSVSCLEDGACIGEQDCMTKDVWQDVYAGFKTQLQATTLMSLVKGKSLPATSTIQKIFECRAPRKGSSSLKL